MGNPRTELVSKKCGRHHAQNVSQFNENYSKVIASMQKSMRENKFAIGEEGKTPNRVYVLAQCMEDLSKDDCEICFDSIKTQIPGCFPHRSARVYYDGCFLRVENYSFFQESSSQDYDITRCSDAQNVQDNNFDLLVKQLITELKTEAPENRGYAEGQVTFYVLTVYGMANCWRTLDKMLCANCLANASNEILRCLPSLEARALHAGCYLRYSDSEFVNKPESSANRDAILLYLSIVFGTVGVCILAIVVGYFVGASIHQRRINRQTKQKRLEFDSDITKRSLHFKYSTLEKATNNFNEAVKIGQGGSGEVFKGTLPDGREIAIKRLFLTGKLQNQEVCNEIDIIGQAQHPNLVRFLGCCFTNDDSFLVYEFLANRSLDLILFDEEKKKELTWKKRLVIIIGTAEGLEYLHRDCQVRIIHRDIKASNILLDMKHRPKIADFGIARLNSNDEGVGRSAIAGTFGYMAPEYLAQGRLTDKVDVYSYGVLVLEIIRGEQSNKFQFNDSLDTLVTIDKGGLQSFLQVLEFLRSSKRRLHSGQCYNAHLDTCPVDIITLFNKAVSGERKLEIGISLHGHDKRGLHMECYGTSRTRVPRCIPAVNGRIFLDGCFLRYDNYSFYEEAVDPVWDKANCNSSIDVNTNGIQSSTPEFRKNVADLIDNITASAVLNDGYAVGVWKGVYGLADCWKTVSRNGCRECLTAARREVIGCLPSLEGRALNTGCYLRYSTKKFYSNHSETINNSSEISRTGMVLAIVLSVSAFCMLSVFGGYAAYGRWKKWKQESKNLGLISGSYNKSNLNFKYEILEQATNYFDPSRKLGQGGAGTVYQGTLPNGKTVAVKRLFFSTRQWVDEFFNEVNLISGIQHKNLVKLLGCSIEGPESLLVYEFAPNKSLEQYLFDNNKVKILSWKERYNIIVGTAEGIAFLHGGSESRIIHRDIKTSNVILDENLAPKIADFGLARSFALDRSHLSTGIAGTLGYMAPEYLVKGQLTEKADVYSFGVLVLEIVCNRKSNAFMEDSGSLLQSVWKLYKTDRLTEIVDPSLKGDFSEFEVSRVLKIGLLCTQASVSLRPSMVEVVRMLTDFNSEIPEPNQPPFLNANLLSATTTRSSYSANSLASNAKTKFEASYTSTESSIQSSDGPPLTSKQLSQK
ncbi:Cysteine-rich receptor-like protein kinase 42 [Abeliophyllum distichum]|uniref:Cysteine-rich receptor-like protein kinase 42 n=1 Tax=Abeliophyllum distichum TaxID=126358 RepID=A0ABD1SHW0_9LAMI